MSTRQELEQGIADANAYESNGSDIMTTTELHQAGTSSIED